MKVAVVGMGAMGKWFASFAKKNLGEVIVVSRDIEKAKRVARELGVRAETRGRAAVEADMTFVAAPIAVTPDVVKSLATQVKKGALLADMASAKRDVVNMMRRLNVDVELVSIHPLFGPGAKTINGKDVLVVPVKPGPKYNNLKRTLTRLGANVTEVDAEEHDKLMAIVQCMTHFLLIVYISAVAKMKGLGKAQKIRTPLSATLMNTAKALLAGQPKLYAEIQVHNPHAKIVRRAILDACHTMDTAFSAGKSGPVEKIFKSSADIIGEKALREAYKKMYKEFEGV
ncbi:MAG: prephenate dehydrogenase/arogenate dehydrogenase family protein [Candidatus Hadarchaeota archaeon]